MGEGTRAQMVRRERAMRLPDRLLRVIGAAGLVVFGLAYWLTYEPAPRIRLEWRPDVTTQQRTALERKYLLVNPREPLTNGSLAYDLLDTRESNIRALIEDPALADLNDLQPDVYAVPFDIEYGEAWMWIVHRTPGVRDARVRAVLLIALVVMTVGGLGADRLWTRAWRRSRATGSTTGTR